MKSAKSTKLSDLISKPVEREEARELLGLPVVLDSRADRIRLVNLAQQRLPGTWIIRETKQCYCEAPAKRGDIRFETTWDKSDPDRMTIKATYYPCCSCSACGTIYRVTMEQKPEDRNETSSSVST